MVIMLMHVFTTKLCSGITNFYLCSQVNLESLKPQGHISVDYRLLRYPRAQMLFYVSHVSSTTISAELSFESLSHIYIPGQYEKYVGSYIDQSSCVSTPEWPIHQVRISAVLGSWAMYRLPKSLTRSSFTDAFRITTIFSYGLYDPVYSVLLQLTALCGGCCW
jgi:hypothetical protein